MKRIYVLAEGQTEETFLRDVLGPHLLPFEISLNPVIVSTKRMKSGLKFKGGISHFKQIQNDLRLLLRDSSVAAVSTMLDYYGLPLDFPGRSAVKGSCFERVAILEAALSDSIDDSRLIPYLSLHEFEALLFAGVEEFASVFPRIKIPNDLRDSSRSPEEINDGSTTHPAARILSHYPTYQKPFHGPLILGRIGLPAIRARCRHFDSWVSRLEALGNL